jgi:hypothetical protein
MQELGRAILERTGSGKIAFAQVSSERSIRALQRENKLCEKN